MDNSSKKEEIPTEFHLNLTENLKDNFHSGRLSKDSPSHNSVSDNIHERNSKMSHHSSQSIQSAVQQASSTNTIMADEEILDAS